MMKPCPLGANAKKQGGTNCILSSPFNQVFCSRPNRLLVLICNSAGRDNKETASHTSYNFRLKTAELR